MTIEHAPQSSDKSGNDLKAQRFQMLADIAKELSEGEVVFSTHFDAVMHLRNVLKDPNKSIKDIAVAVATEPLVSAKLLQLANSVVYNSSGREIVDLTTAIQRMGLNTVRATAMSVATAQLMRSKGMSEFHTLTKMLWEHSVLTAAAARVITKTLTRLNPEEALLAGLVHDLGVFYMLYRAVQYEELRQRPDTLKYVIMQWHESVGVSLLNALGLPPEIVAAASDHDQLRPPPAPPLTLTDIVYIANMLAGGHFEWVMQDNPAETPELIELEEKYGYLRPEISQQFSEMQQIFAG